MKTNKLDNHIKKKLQNRTFEPSVSAWERLSIQLDEQSKRKKRGWFFYISAAASILLLVSIGFKLLSSDKEEIKINDIIVHTKIDTNEIDQKIEKFLNEVPIEKAMVKVYELEKKQVKIKNNKNIIPTKKKFKKPMTTAGISSKNNKTIIAKLDEQQNEHPTKVKIIKENIFKQDPNSKIKINSDDLLFAVTHSSKEVKAYYAKHNLTREEVIKTIKSELQKKNININPNTILAEVERTIGEEDFENNFLKSIKRRVSNFATVLASRND